MTNFLKGIQYRDLKDYYGWNEVPYGEWTDMPDNPASYTFAKDTQFRVKPLYVYTAVVTGFDKETVSGDKDKVMSFVAGAIESDKDVNVSRTNKAASSVAAHLENTKVQFSLDGSTWRSVIYLSDAGHSSPVKFRQRPDTYFKVRTSSPVTSAELTFDDIELMLNYVNNKARTTDSNLNITRERYV